MVCAQGILWRVACQMASAKEGASNSSIAGLDDTSRPGSSCLHTMEDCQILIGELAACNMEVLVALWGLEKFYDSIPFKLMRSHLNLCGYPLEVQPESSCSMGPLC